MLCCFHQNMFLCHIESNLLKDFLFSQVHTTIQINLYHFHDIYLSNSLNFVFYIFYSFNKIDLSRFPYRTEVIVILLYRHCSFFLSVKKRGHISFPLYYPILNLFVLQNGLRRANVITFDLLFSFLINSVFLLLKLFLLEKNTIYKAIMTT